MTSRLWRCAVKNVLVRAVGVCLAVVFLAFVVVASDVKEHEEPFTLEPHHYKGWSFVVYEPGPISISAVWTGTTSLKISLYAPGQDDPVLERTFTSPASTQFSVLQSMVDAGTQWRVRVSNLSDQQATGTLEFSHPKTLPVIDSFRTDLDLLIDEPGIARYAGFPGQEYTLTWRTTYANKVSIETSCGAVFAERSSSAPATDCPETSADVSRDGSRSEMLYDQGASFTLHVSNAHGTVEKRLRILPKSWVGYEQAVCIGCAACHECGHASQAEQIGALLREVAVKINAGCIRNNANLDRFGDPYLRGALSTDMLAKMSGLIVYVSDEDAPDLSARGVCDTAYGWTPGTRAFILLCANKPLNGLLLLHELEHQTDPRTTECRAAWVAQFCYGCPNGGIPCPTCSQ